jgi:NAD(P)H-dependent flavin oxidoreductase YrpB (nitropropane dioxygenase family)
MATHAKAALHTPLCDLLGIRYPICQAGMGYVARSELAAAVSEAGGLGVLAAAHTTPEELRAEIRRVRDRTDKPFGVDILFASVRVEGEEAERFTDAVKGWADVTLKERVPVLVAGLVARLAPQAPDDERRRWRRNSMTPGMTESMMMARITRVKFCLTTGMLPKAYPPSTKTAIQAMPPVTL